MCVVVVVPALFREPTASLFFFLLQKTPNFKKNNFMALVLTTVLDAVNTMLSSIGESPISTLEENTTADAAVAQNLLDEETREVQDMGWNFNTEDDVPFVRDGDGEIEAPSNVLRFTVNQINFQDMRPVIRGAKFYDAENRTYAFTKDLTAKVVYLLDFTELPQSARWAITLRATRKFYRRFMDADDTEVFTREDEQVAWSALKRHEAETGHYNIFNEYDAARPLRRASRLRYS